MTAKEQLKELVDEMTEGEARRLIELYFADSDDEELSDEEARELREAMEAVRNGDVVGRAQFEANLRQ